MTDYRCVNGHDRCYGGTSAGPECPYCEKVTPQSLNQLAAECHAANQHWWHNPATGERLDRNKGELLMLTVSEISEAMEGERKDLADDHLPHRRMAEVELADAIIRLMDYAGGFELDLDANMPVGLQPMPENKAEAMLQIVAALTKAHEAIHAGPHWHVRRICHAIGYIQRYAEFHSYDLDGAVAEKRAYNATRADHKAAARLAPGGKQW